MIQVLIVSSDKGIVFVILLSFLMQKEETSAVFNIEKVLDDYAKISPGKIQGLKLGIEKEDKSRWINGDRFRKIPAQCKKAARMQTTWIKRK